VVCLCIVLMSVSKYKILSLCLVSWLWCGYVAVASSESSIGSKDLDQTPTWAVACVCTVFILISLTLEKSLHKVGTVCHHFQSFFSSLLFGLVNLIIITVFLCMRLTIKLTAPSILCFSFIYFNWVSMELLFFFSIAFFLSLFLRLWYLRLIPEFAGFCDFSCTLSVLPLQFHYLLPRKILLSFFCF